MLYCFVCLSGEGGEGEDGRCSQSTDAAFDWQTIERLETEVFILLN